MGVEGADGIKAGEDESMMVVGREEEEGMKDAVGRSG